MAVIVRKRKKKKTTLTKGTTKFVRPEKPLSALQVGKFRNELQKQKSKAMATVNRRYNPVNPSIGGAAGSRKGVPFTKGIATLLQFNIKKPRISAMVNPVSRFKPKYRVGRVKLIRRLGEF
jgi:hypothetical protein